MIKENEQREVEGVKPRGSRSRLSLCCSRNAGNVRHEGQDVRPSLTTTHVNGVTKTEY